MPTLTFRLLIGLAFLLLNLVSCQREMGSETIEQGMEAGSILFADDFSNPPSGWGIGDRDSALVEYSDGGLRIQVNESHYDFWSVAGQNFADAQIEVDATPTGGTLDNDYGIICRYQDKDNFYMLIISSDGYYGAAKRKNGEYSMIGPNQLQYSDVIRQGRATNRLRVDCVGDSLSLSVNGQQLMEASAHDFPSGDVGLIAGSYAVKGVDILFDNFVVREPGE